MPRSDAPARVHPPNRLLAALPPHEYDRLAPRLEHVALTSRAVLLEPGAPIAHVYFPASGVMSLLAQFHEGSIEVGVVGQEGAIGLPLALGVDEARHRALVQVPGEALRMRAADFRKYVRPGSPLHALLLRYTDVFLTQLSQSAGCNALHAVEERMCRWLLLVHSRVGTPRLPITHAFLAAMLGVRRASVTEVAGRLQDAGLIRSGRGQITLLNLPGLESAACECFRTVQAELERLFPSPTP